MTTEGPRKCGLRGKWPLVFAPTLALLGGGWSGSSHAEHSAFKVYGPDQGLTDLSAACLTQDQAGELLVCTEHGAFVYDGRRFVNLGTEHGLPAGGIVYGIDQTSTGRIAIRYLTELYVSDRPSDPAHPTTSLSFIAADHPGISFYNQWGHLSAPWHGGFVFLTMGETIGVMVSSGKRARFESLGYTATEQALLHDAVGVFSTGNGLWETLKDGRLCAADPGAVRCYGTEDGLVDGPWLDIVNDPEGRILARSASSVATFDPSVHRWSVVALPDQGGQYDGYGNELGLFSAPDRQILTQAVHGLAVRGPAGWRELSVAKGAPDGLITGALMDRSGQLWFCILGKGLVRWVDYGHWAAIEKSDGLSAGISWQTARSTDGGLWVTNDGGVDELLPQASSLHVVRTFPFNSYALAATPAGEIWAGYRNMGVRVIDPRKGSMWPVVTPDVEAIVPGRDHAVWLGTDKGLYRVDDGSGPPFHPVLVKSWPTPVQGIALDGGGGVYYLTGGWLHHRHPDGTDVTITGTGWTTDIEAVALAIARDGSLWMGGQRGLRHLVLSGDRITSNQLIPVEDIDSTTVHTVTIDHRGWIWVGTSLGVSVFNGRRWVSINADQGLLSNDVSEDGIREDPDGSVWISTAEGLSRLKDPDSLFTAQPPSVMVTGAHLGTIRLTAASQPYTRDPLSIQLGTPNYGAERSVLFRYRLSGVDKDWVTSSSGDVSYPFIPPGRHVLTVIGYDTLSHRTSMPVSRVVDVAYPWWRRWWSEALWAALAVAGIYGIVRIRLHAMYARQTRLRRVIAQATAQLRHQATHDSLTGLLNRAEVETRLAARLAMGDGDLVAALLDVDHFKRINDRHGHLGGDEVLRALGHLVARCLREGEYAGRYGGEEILLVLSDADGCAAERVLKLHLAIRHDTFRVSDGPISVTCSIGVAWAGVGDRWESLIGRADAALYQAKHDGRDRVIESQPQPVRVEGGD